MDSQTNQKQYTEEEVIGAILSFNANILMNAYTNENVIFGRINANDKIPIKQYLVDIGFRNIDRFFDKLFLNGHNIKDGYVIEKDFNDRCYELYCDKMNAIFDNVPICKSYQTENIDLFYYKFGLYDYLKGLFPLFNEIIRTEVAPDFFTAIPNILDEKEKQKYYLAASKFLIAIKIKRLRQGRRIDRYIKNMKFISPFIKRLIKKQKGHFYLKNNDLNSIDYKLALFSCIRFYNEDNANLFELKMLQWEENTSTENNYA